MAYQHYLQSQHWQTKRLEKLQHRPFCQVCRSTKNLHIHHKKYQHDGQSLLGQEKLTTLVTLCASCHKLTHHHFGIEAKKLNKKFCRVRRLLELGVIKQKAFWLVANPPLYDTVIHGSMFNKKAVF